jgi:hypothetical protein
VDDERKGMFTLRRKIRIGGEIWHTSRDLRRLKKGVSIQRVRIGSAAARQQRVCPQAESLGAASGYQEVGGKGE